MPDSTHDPRTHLAYFHDFRGLFIPVGSEVRVVAYGDIPAYLCGRTGTVVGHGRTRVRVDFGPEYGIHAAGGAHFWLVGEAR